MSGFVSVAESQDWRDCRLSLRESSEELRCFRGAKGDKRFSATETTYSGGRRLESWLPIETPDADHAEKPHDRRLKSPHFNRTGPSER
jgi:hypothetical protein